jgi:hypothetical protein
LITLHMKKWLETEYPELLKKPNRTIKLCVYLNRIQKRIERELEYTLWLAVHRPDILLNKQITLNEYGHINRARDHTYERMKILMLALKALMQKENVNVELVLNAD